MSVSADRNTLTRHISGVSNIVFAQNAASAKPKLFAGQGQSNPPPTFPAQKFLGTKAKMAIKVKLSARMFSNQRAAINSNGPDTGINLDKQTN